MWSLINAVGLIPAVAAQAGVIPTFPNGPTNPEKPGFYPIGAQINQTSESRLLTINGVDDFCLYGPMEPGPDSLIGNVEPSVVAYCTKPRNGARLIPDGTIQSAHLIKTAAYVQIHGNWDGTRVNLVAGDTGGELDPHGAENKGNPVGGNVTTSVATGTDTFYEEWMSFISATTFCVRICTAEVNGVSAALQCEHELDVMGCRWVMAIEDFFRPETNGTFTYCEGEVAAPPGLYSIRPGVTSTFRQRYTGTHTNSDGSKATWTVGQTVTPSAPAFWPKKSNCISYPSIANKVDMANLMVTAAPTLYGLENANALSTPVVESTSQAVVTTPSSVIPTDIAAATPGTSNGTDPNGNGGVLPNGGNGGNGGNQPNGNGDAPVASGNAAGANNGSGAFPASTLSTGIAAFGVIAGILAVF